MERKVFLSSIFILLCQISLGQNSSYKILKGKVFSSVKYLNDVYVINIQTDKAVSTTDGGFFEISVAIGDTLMFSSMQIEAEKIVINKEDFEKDLLLVHLKPHINKLDELIIVKYNHINAYSLGIIQKPAKNYSPAERRLKTASGADIEGNTDGTTGASAGLDPLFSWMSGRTAMLRKELLVETKELLLKQIENWFSKNYFISKLKISDENVMGFLYFAVENIELQACLKSKNKVKAEFTFAKLAIDYLELQKQE